ncbi:tRNA lysidine(34) synthetase TilS [Nocardioides sp. Iso805N]|uniref:tRNA lysidine(34) synthetase TilS n=1 Tax=Nocardioides sp. Iso805N TaxID=1283287 RepID=UPI0012FC611F|nr:tRNA lysidine(34) synthetase TilS [Nocardioides sp. Iso805N]
MSLPAPVAAVRRGVRDALPILAAGDGRTWSPHIAPEGGAVLVACSGGADSLALLSATIFELRRSDARVIGVVVDHGLQDGSAEHTSRVVAQMAAMGAHETASIRVSVDSTAIGVEAGAREARYAALAQLATHFGARSVLLGHTRDDQAETVLLGLARGSGGRSIAGMRHSFNRGSVVFLRPLLDVTREQTEATCRHEGIDFWVDPHNADPRFLRARVRHDVLPVLERELGPGVAATLARTAEQLRPDMEFLDDFAVRLFGEAREVIDDEPTGGLGVRVRIDVVEPMGWSMRTRVARLAALEAGCPGDELFAVHINAVADLLLSGAGRRQIQLPGHITAYQDTSVLAFRRTGEGPSATAG